MEGNVFEDALEASARVTSRLVVDASSSTWRCCSNVEMHHVLGIDQGFAKADEIPLDFRRSRVSVVVSDAAGPPCAHLQGRGRGDLRGIHALRGRWRDGRADETPFVTAQQETVDLNSDVFRVVAVPYKELPQGKAVCGVADEAGLTLLGCIAFIDPPKDSAREALAVRHRRPPVQVGSSSRGGSTWREPLHRRAESSCQSSGPMVPHHTPGSRAHGRCMAETGWTFCGPQARWMTALFHGARNLGLARRKSLLHRSVHGVFADVAASGVITLCRTISAILCPTMPPCTSAERVWIPAHTRASSISFSACAKPL